MISKKKKDYKGKSQGINELISFHFALNAYRVGVEHI